MPTHCTSTCYGFHARRIDDVKCCLLSNHAPLVRTRLRVGRVWDDDDDERRGEGETRCRLIAWSSRKTSRGPPSLTSPSDERITINSTMCLRNMYTAERFGIYSRPVMYNLAIRKCTFSPLLAPRLKIFEWKFATPPGIEPRTCWARGRHATTWAQRGEHGFENIMHTKFQFNTGSLFSCPIYFI